MEMFEISNHLVEYKGVIYGHNLQLFIIKKEQMTPIKKKKKNK